MASQTKNAGSGTGTTWSNPGNITASDNVYATYVVPALGTTNQLDAKSFGFTIPTLAVIDGVVVSIERKASVANELQDDTVGILINSSPGSGGSNKASASLWGTTDSTPSYGSPSDLWNLTLTPTIVNNAGFGAYLKVKNTDAYLTPTASVDLISMVVYYSINDIKYSTTGIGEIRYGTTVIKKVYYGSTQVI